MPSAVRTLLGGLLAGSLLGLAAPATPAASAASPTTEVLVASTVVRLDRCTVVDWYYSLGAVWTGVAPTVHLTAIDASGAVVADELDTALSDSGDFTICATEPGSYTMTTTASGCDPYGRCEGPETSTNAFELREPRSRIRFDAPPETRRASRVLRLVVTRKIERATDIFQHLDGSVALERRTGHGWERVRGSRTFAEHGHATLDYRIPSRSTTVRVVTVGAGERRSATRSVAVPPRAG